MIEIKKSKKLKLLSTSFVGVVTISLLLVSATIISAFRELINIDAPLARFIVTATILFVAVASVLTAWFRDINKKYLLDDEKLIISNHSFGAGTTKKIIKLESKSVSSMKLTQSFLGKIFDYGTITLEVDNYSEKEHHSLANINNPHALLKEIDSHLNK